MKLEKEYVLPSLGMLNCHQYFFTKALVSPCDKNRIHHSHRDHSWPYYHSFSKWNFAAEIKSQHFMVSFLIFGLELKVLRMKICMSVKVFHFMYVCFVQPVSKNSVFRSTSIHNYTVKTMVPHNSPL